MARWRTCRADVVDARLTVVVFAVGAITFSFFFFFYCQQIFTPIIGVINGFES